RRLLFQLSIDEDMYADLAADTGSKRLEVGVRQAGPDIDDADGLAVLDDRCGGEHADGGAAGFDTCHQAATGESLDNGFAAPLHVVAELVRRVDAGDSFTVGVDEGDQLQPALADARRQC